FGEIDPIMQDRPQHPVGEAVVIFLVVGRRQVDRDKAALAALDHPRLVCGTLIADLAAPSEPQPFAMLERGLDGDRETAGLARALGIGDRDAVRNYDETRHQTSSHFSDRRVAELMIPAIE